MVRNLLLTSRIPSAKKWLPAKIVGAIQRPAESLVDSASFSCCESRQEAESGAQSRQVAFYQAKQSWLDWLIPFLMIYVCLCWYDLHFLTIKAPITTAADDIHKYFFIVFQKK